MELANKWKDYEVIDASLGMKYERWGDVFLLRPDPQIIWDNGDLMEKYKNQLHAVYHRSNKGGGNWEIKNKDIPSRWQIKYHNLVFNIKLMGFFLFINSILELVDPIVKYLITRS